MHITHNNLFDYIHSNPAPSNRLELSMSANKHYYLLILFLCIFMPTFIPALQGQASAEQPDLTGNYDIATLTPLERPGYFGNKLYLSAAEAKRIMSRQASVMKAGDRSIDPDRDAPPSGGDGPRQRESGLRLRE